MDSWLRHANNVLDAGEQQEKYPPFRHKAFARCVASSCMPVACAPCVIWSAIGRCLACPFQCVFRGVPNICNSNAITACTDSAVNSYNAMTTEHAKLAALASHMISDASSEDLQRFSQVIDRIERVFKATPDIRTRYALTEAFINPIMGREITPSQVLNELKEVRNRVFIGLLSKNKDGANANDAIVEEPKEPETQAAANDIDIVIVIQSEEP